MYRACKTFRFEAAHQLDQAFSKACTDTVHGHSYKVEVVVEANCLDGNLMVVDFGVISAMLKDTIAEWDHALILSGTLAREYAGTPNKKIITFPVSPTAEIMADLLYKAVDARLTDLNAPNGLRVHSVRVHETEGNWAECHR